jgi:hypothetical protein
MIVSKGSDLCATPRRVCTTTPRFVCQPHRITVSGGDERIRLHHISLNAMRAALQQLWLVLCHADPVRDFADDARGRQRTTLAHFVAATSRVRYEE